MQLSRDDRDETRGNVRDWWCGVAGKINSSITVVIIELDRKRIGSTFFNHFWFKSKPDWTLCVFDFLVKRGSHSNRGPALETSVVALISLLAIKIQLDSVEWKSHGSQEAPADHQYLAIPISHQSLLVHKFCLMSASCDVPFNPLELLTNSKFLALSQHSHHWVLMQIIIQFKYHHQSPSSLWCDLWSPLLLLFVFVSCDDPCLVTQRLIFHPARRVCPLITATINKNKCMSSSRIYGFAYESTEDTTSFDWSKYHWQSNRDIVKALYGNTWERLLGWVRKDNPQLGATLYSANQSSIHHSSPLQYKAAPRQL